MELSINDLLSWEKFDISYSQYRVMEAIFRMRECLLTELSRELDYAVSSCAEIISRLVNKKLVRKKNDSGDRRKTWLALTTKGKKLVEEVIAEKNVIMEKIYSRLNKREQALFVNIQRKLEEIKKELGR